MQRGRRGSDLHTDANGTVAHVGPAGGLHRVIVDVNDLVQVLGHLLCDLRKLGKVKVPAYTSVVTSNDTAARQPVTQELYQPIRC